MFLSGFLIFSVSFSFFCLPSLCHCFFLSQSFSVSFSFFFLSSSCKLLTLSTYRFSLSWSFLFLSFLVRIIFNFLTHPFFLLPPFSSISSLNEESVLSLSFLFFSTSTFSDVLLPGWSRERWKKNEIEEGKLFVPPVGWKRE